MKIWALTILCLQNKLELLCEAIERRTDDIAMDTVSDTMTVYTRLLEQNDIKRRVVNLRVLGNRMASRLSDDELHLVKTFLGGKPLCEIAEDTGVSHSTACRRMRTAMYKCTRVMNLLGFDESKLKKQYSELPLVKKTYAKLSRALHAAKPAESDGSGSGENGGKDAASRTVTDNPKTNLVRSDGEGVRASCDRPYA